MLEGLLGGGAFGGGACGGGACDAGPDQVFRRSALEERALAAGGGSAPGVCLGKDDALLGTASASDEGDLDELDVRVVWGVPSLSNAVDADDLESRGDDFESSISILISAVVRTSFCEGRLACAGRPYFAASLPRAETGGSSEALLFASGSSSDKLYILAAAAAAARSLSLREGLRELCPDELFNILQIKQYTTATAQTATRPNTIMTPRGSPESASLNLPKSSLLVANSGTIGSPLLSSGRVLSGLVGFGRKLVGLAVVC